MVDAEFEEAAGYIFRIRNVARDVVFALADVQEQDVGAVLKTVPAFFGRDPLNLRLDAGQQLIQRCSHR